MFDAVKKTMPFSPRKRQGGYTLIEMSVVVAVVGLLLASFISAYSIYIKTKSQQTTENNASLLKASLSNFLIQYGRYPCPARLDLPRTDPLYGMETECDPLVTTGPLTYPAVVTAGTCANGLCFENGLSTVDVDPSPVTFSMVTPKIRRGAVPFRALGIPEDQSEDGYGNRFQYAVTENLAVTTSYVRMSGGVVVRNGSGAELTRADNRAHYIVFSSGPDRAGAYSRYGQLMNPCGTGLDAENCNTSAANPLAIYRAAEYAPANTAAHFDDYVKFYSSVETPLWRVSDASGFNISDLIDAALTGQIGIAQDNPATNATVDVAGEVRADNGNAHAAEICDPAQANCIPLSKFGGDVEDFKCEPNKYVAAFGSPIIPDGAPGYDATLPASKFVKCNATSDIKCPAGEIMSGVNADGTLNCTAVVACPAKSDSLCSTSYVVPAGLQGSTYTTPVIGSSRQRTYICNTISGITMWRTQSTTGACNCTAVDEYVDTACNTWQGYGNWTGVVTQHHVHACPANTDTWTVVSNGCVCEPTTQTQVVSCPSGLTGSRTRQRDWVCSSATSGYWTAWSIVADNCVCTPNTQTQTLTCGAGYTGAINQHRDFTCPAASWGAWVTDSNTCTCVPTSETRTIGCPAYYTGSIQQHRDWTCSAGTGSWGPWIEDANSCSCSGSTQTQTLACTGAHMTGNRTEQRTYNCGTSSWGPWVETSNNCSCVADVETRAVACTPPLVGSITEQRTYDCGTSSWGPWIEAANNCGAVAYSWVSKTAATGPYGAPLSVAEGSSCSTPGSSSACSAPAGGGQYWHYATCQCE